MVNAVAEAPEVPSLRLYAELNAEYRCQGHSDHIRMLQLPRNRSPIRQALEKMIRKNAGRDDIRDLRVQNHVCDEPGRAKDDVAIGGGIEHPRDATCVRLTDLPVDGDLPEEPSGWFHDGVWYLLQVYRCTRDAARVLQRILNSGTKTSEETGVETSKGCCTVSHRAGEGGVITCKVSGEGPDESGRRCLVGAIVVERRSESEEGVRGEPEQREAEDDPGNGAVDRPEVS